MNSTKFNCIRDCDIHIERTSKQKSNFQETIKKSKENRNNKSKTLKSKKDKSNHNMTNELNNITLSSQDISMGSFEHSKIICKDFDKIKKSKLKNTKNRKNSEKISLSKLENWVDHKQNVKINRSAMIFKSLKGNILLHEIQSSKINKESKLNERKKNKNPFQQETKEDQKIKEMKNLIYQTKTTASQEYLSFTENLQQDDFQNFSLAKQNVQIASQNLKKQIDEKQSAKLKSKSIQSLKIIPLSKDSAENSDYSFNRASISLKISNIKCENNFENSSCLKSVLNKKIESLGHVLDEMKSKPVKEQKKRFSDLDLQVMKTLRQSFDNSELKLKTKSRYNFAQKNSELKDEDILVKERRETWQNNRDSNVLSIMKLVKTFLLGSDKKNQNLVNEKDIKTNEILNLEKKMIQLKKHKLNSNQTQNLNQDLKTLN